MIKRRLCRSRRLRAVLHAIVPGLLIANSLSLAQNDVPTAPGQTWSVKTLVEYHLSMKKDLHVQDVYKMFYQASFGVEHLLADSMHIRSGLIEELDSADSTRGELLLERISLDAEMVRVNLGPFKKERLDPDLLVRSMVVSSRQVRADTLLFMRMWDEFVALVDHGLLKFLRDEVTEWNTRISSDGIFAVHHSKAYTDRNTPAYRVVSKRAFEKYYRLPE